MCCTARRNAAKPSSSRARNCATAAACSTATIESKTNFFAAVPKGDTAHAVCIPLHRGHSTIVLETRITRGDGKLAAIVTQTQLIFAKNDDQE